MVNKRGTKHQGTRVALKLAELQAVLALARKHSLRNYAMILITVNHGLRASETCGLRLKDVNLQTGHLSVRRGKSSDAVDHPMSQVEVDALATLCRTKKPEDTVFDVTPHQFWHFFKRYGQELGWPLSKQMPHCLKHTTAKQMILQGKPLPAIQKWMGHKSLSSTAEYLKMDNEEAVELVFKNGKAVI